MRLTLSLSLTLNQVTLDFGTRNVMVKDLWNSRMLSGGDGKSSTATFKLKKQDGSWFGERKEAFGFAADGIITKLPSILQPNRT